MNTRTRNFLVGGLVIALLLAAVTFPLWRPFFVNEVVNESFPGISEAMLPTFAALAEDQQAAFQAMATQNPDMAVAMAEAAMSPDQVVPEAEQAMPEMDEPVILGQGSFGEIDVIHGGEGSATIYELTDGNRVLRLEDFRVTNGPDLHVVLAESDAPLTHDELGDNYVDLGQLKGNVGNQNYDIPAEVDLSQYRSVVIYCLPFQVVFSTATLSQP